MRGFVISAVTEEVVCVVEDPTGVAVANRESEDVGKVVSAIGVLLGVITATVVSEAVEELDRYVFAWSNELDEVDMVEAAVGGFELVIMNVDELRGKGRESEIEIVPELVWEVENDDVFRGKGGEDNKIEAVLELVSEFEEYADVSIDDETVSVVIEVEAMEVEKLEDELKVGVSVIVALGPSA